MFVFNGPVKNKNNTRPGEESTLTRWCLVLGIADPRLRDKIQKFSRESGSLAAITIIGHNTQHYLPMGATALLPPKKLAITAHENSPENVFPKLQDSFIK